MSLKFEMIFPTSLFNILRPKVQIQDDEKCVIRRRSFYSYCCGIVGYLGDGNTNEILLHGINAMISRGYDSCGVCTLEEGRLKVTKCCSVGTPADSVKILSQKVLSSHKPSRIGIGHTRWATVGKPSDKNSHPHVDLSGKLALVHNGTISNTEELYLDYYCDLLKNRFNNSSNNVVLNGSKSNKKAEFQNEGSKFKLPDSDSESIAIFVGLEYEKVGDLFEAFKNTIKRLKGTWALCMMCLDYPNSLFVAAHQAPLLVAHSEAGLFVGSEPTVFAKFVKDCVVLNDGEVFQLSLENVESYYRRSKVLKLEHEVIEESPDPYPNWYVKELSEQVFIGRLIISYLNFNSSKSSNNNSEKSQVSDDMNKLLKLNEKYSGNDNLTVLGGDPLEENLLLSRVDISKIGFNLPSVSEETKKRLVNTRRLLLVGCGTSLYAATYVSKILHKFKFFDLLEVDDASDLTLYRYYHRDNTVLHISNSGETLDSILSSNFIKKINPNTLNLALINTLHTSLERSSDATLYLRIGREKSVPSTKAFTSQIVVLLILSLYILTSNQLEKSSEDDLNNEDNKELDELYQEHYGSKKNYNILSLYKSLSLFPLSISKLLNENDIYEKIAKKLLKEKIVYILGRGCGHVAAQEMALKMKEVGYIQAEGVLSGAMKHGYYAMIREDQHTPTISIITSEDREMTTNSTMQLKARGSFIIAMTDLNEEMDFADIIVHLPSVGPLTAALAVIPIQIVTSKIALLSNRNPDIPRGLTKTVTTL